MTEICDLIKSDSRVACLEEPDILAKLTKVLEAQEKKSSSTKAPRLYKSVDLGTGDNRWSLKKVDGTERGARSSTMHSGLEFGSRYDDNIIVQRSDIEVVDNDHVQVETTRHVEVAAEASTDPPRVKSSSVEVPSLPVSSRSAVRVQVTNSGGSARIQIADRFADDDQVAQPSLLHVIRWGHSSDDETIVVHGGGAEAIDDDSMQMTSLVSMGAIPGDATDGSLCHVPLDAEKNGQLTERNSPVEEQGKDLIDESVADQSHATHEANPDVSVVGLDGQRHEDMTAETEATLRLGRAVVELQKIKKDRELLKLRLDKMKDSLPDVVHLKLRVEQCAEAAAEATRAADRARSEILAAEQLADEISSKEGELAKMKQLFSEKWIELAIE